MTRFLKNRTGKVPAIVSVRIDHIHDYQLITLEGRLVYENVKQVKEQIETRLGKYKGYILDKTKVQFIDITGIGFILNLARQMREHSEGLAIVLQNNHELSRLLSLPRVHDYVHIAANKLEAIQMLTEKHPLLSLDDYGVLVERRDLIENG